MMDGFGPPYSHTADKHLRIRIAVEHLRHFFARRLIFLGKYAKARLRALPLEYIVEIKAAVFKIQCAWMNIIPRAVPFGNIPFQRKHEECFPQRNQADTQTFRKGWFGRQLVILEAFRSERFDELGLDRHISAEICSAHCFSRFRFDIFIR
jgi:hypothetical protein